MGTAPTGMRSPLSGYNHNVRYNTRVYHVQTEDSGAANPHIFTHLFLQGMIVATLRTDYEPAEREGQVRSVMQEQHKRIMKQLRRGEFDERIAALTGAEAVPIPAAVVEEAPAAEAPSVEEAATTEVPAVAAEAPAVEEEAATTEVPAVAAEAPAAEAPAALPAEEAPAASPPEPAPAAPEVPAEVPAAPPEPAATTQQMPPVRGVPAPEPALKTPPGGYPMVVGDDQRSNRTLIGYPAPEESGLPEVLLEGMTESEIRSLRRGQAISLGLTTAPEQVPVDHPVFDGFPMVELDLGDDDSLELDLEAITNLDLDSDQAPGGWEGLELDLAGTPTPAPPPMELIAPELPPALQGAGEDLELDLAATDEEAAAELQEEEEVSTEWDEPSLEWEPAPPEPSDEEKTGRRKRPSLPPAPVDPAGERKKRPSLPVAPVERVEIPVNVKTRPTGRGGKRGR